MPVIVPSCDASQATMLLAALQVELNTIAASFGSLSTLVSRMHQYLLNRAAACPSDAPQLPENNAMDEVADALAAAVCEYGVPGAVALMVVQAGERNAYDQQVRRGSTAERRCTVDMA